MAETWSSETAVITLCGAGVLLGLFAFLRYIGIFHKVDVKIKKHPLPVLQIAYKFGQGPYYNSGKIFSETAKLAPSGVKFIGLYYDSPEKVAKDKLRWAVGCVLAEGNETPNPVLLTTLAKNGYKQMKLPVCENAIVATFPITCTLAIFVAIWKVYPALSKFCTDHNLSEAVEGSVCMEVCGNGDGMYVLPMDNFSSYFVPEAIQASSSN